MPDHQWGQFESKNNGYQCSCTLCTKVVAFPAILDAQGPCPGHAPSYDVARNTNCRHIMPSGLSPAIRRLSDGNEKCVMCQRIWVTAETAGRPVSIPLYTQQGQANNFLAQAQGAGQSPAYNERLINSGATIDPLRSESVIAPEFMETTTDQANAHFRVNYNEAEWKVIDPNGYIRKSVNPYRKAEGHITWTMLLLRWVLKWAVRIRHKWGPRPSAREMHPHLPLVHMPTGRRRKKCLSQV